MIDDLKAIELSDRLEPYNVTRRPLGPGRSGVVWALPDQVLDLRDRAGDEAEAVLPAR